MKNTQRWTQIVAEYTVIYSGEELTAILKQFEASKRSGGKGLGDWTRRINLKSLVPIRSNTLFASSNAHPISSFMPTRMGTSPEKRAPPEILHALVNHCSHRLRFIYPKEYLISKRYSSFVYTPTPHVIGPDPKT